MQLEKKLKPSFHKANARYRGVTEHSQYTNFILESVHDLFLLSNITMGNEKVGIKGHDKQLQENFLSIMTGDGEVGKSNIFTASTLQKIDYSRKVVLPQSLNDWSKVNGATVSQSGDAFTISSPGLLDPVGVSTNIYVEPGDKIYIRLKVKSANGAPYFSFGSNNMRIGPDTNGDTKMVAIEAGGEFMLVDYVLSFGYSEAVSLNLNVHEDPDVLSASSVQIKDLEIYYMEEIPVKASSFHEVIKPGIDELEERINSIR